MLAFSPEIVQEEDTGNGTVQNHDNENGRQLTIGNGSLGAKRHEGAFNGLHAANRTIVTSRALYPFASRFGAIVAFFANCGFEQTLRLAPFQRETFDGALQDGRTNGGPSGRIVDI